jgi:hypothetical protein
MTENILRGIQTDFYRKSEIGLSDIDQVVEFRQMIFSGKAEPKFHCPVDKNIFLVYNRKIQRIKIYSLFSYLRVAKAKNNPPILGE